MAILSHFTIFVNKYQLYERLTATTDIRNTNKKDNTSDKKLINLSKIDTKQLPFRIPLEEEKFVFS
jgi:hypothetical protein